jgi:hypothetical protein
MIHSLGTEANRICSTIRYNCSNGWSLSSRGGGDLSQSGSAASTNPSPSLSIPSAQILSTSSPEGDEVGGDDEDSQLCWKSLLGCQCYDIFIALDLRICILAAYVHR